MLVLPELVRTFVFAGREAQIVVPGHGLKGRKGGWTAGTSFEEAGPAAPCAPQLTLSTRLRLRIHVQTRQRFKMFFSAEVGGSVACLPQQ